MLQKGRLLSSLRESSAWDLIDPHIMTRWTRQVNINFYSETPEVYLITSAQRFHIRLFFLNLLVKLLGSSKNIVLFLINLFKFKIMVLPWRFSLVLKVSVSPIYRIIIIMRFKAAFNICSPTELLPFAIMKSLPFYTIYWETKEF